MNLVRSATRKVVKFNVANGGNRDSILERANAKFHDVQFTGSPTDPDVILVSMTGSHIYDFQVQEFLEICGCEKYPEI